MTEMNGIAQTDLERLSAFLDGELDPAEAEQLEARLATDQQLSGTLAALRATSEVVGGLPEVDPPRSFTLTPDMIPSRRAYPFLQLTTAVAALAFVLVVGADLFISNAGSSAAVSSDQTFFAADQIAEQDFADLQAAQAEAPAQALAPEDAIIEEAEAQLAAAAEPGAETAADSESQGVYRSEGDAAAAGEAPAESEAGLGEVGADGREALAEEAPAEEEALKAVPGSSLDEVREADDFVEREPFLDLLRILEIGLAGALIVLIGLTLWVRQRG